MGSRRIPASGSGPAPRWRSSAAKPKPSRNSSWRSARSRTDWQDPRTPTRRACRAASPPVSDRDRRRLGTPAQRSRQGRRPGRGPRFRGLVGPAAPPGHGRHRQVLIVYSPNPFGMQPEFLEQTSRLVGFDAAAEESAYRNPAKDNHIPRTAPSPRPRSSPWPASAGSTYQGRPAASRSRGLRSPTTGVSLSSSKYSPTLASYFAQRNPSSDVGFGFGRALHLCRDRMFLGRNVVDVVLACRPGLDEFSPGVVVLNVDAWMCHRRPP